MTKGGGKEIMKKSVAVEQPGIIGKVEQFCYDYIDLRLYVVYTYYDQNGTPLYVGCSRDFYNTHYLNLKRNSWDIEYIGFVFMENEEEIQDAKRYFIEWRNPKYNKRRYKNLQKIDPLEDDFVVKNYDLINRWQISMGVV